MSETASSHNNTEPEVLDQMVTLVNRSLEYLDTAIKDKVDVYYYSEAVLRPLIESPDAAATADTQSWLAELQYGPYIDFVLLAWSIKNREAKVPSVIEAHIAPAILKSAIFDDDDRKFFQAINIPYKKESSDETN